MALTKARNRMIAGSNPHITDTAANLDAGADATAALQSLLNASQARGGQVDIGDARLLINGNLTIPPGVATLCGHWTVPGDLTKNPGTFGGTPPIFNAMGSALLLGPNVTITIGGGGGLKGLLIVRNGIDFPVTGDSTYSGTAVNIDGDDCYVGYCLFLGHDRAIDSNGMGWQKFEWIFGDCRNGVRIQGSFDVTRISNCHFWPFLSIRDTPLTSHHRAGVGFDFNGIDIPVVDNCFTYGYYTGFRLISMGAGNIVNCCADSTQQHAGSYGFLIGNGVNGATGTKLIGCIAYSTENGFGINLPVNDHVQLMAPQCSAVTNVGINVLKGDVSIIGGFLQATVRNIDVAHIESRVVVIGTRFNSLSTPLTSNSRFITIGSIDTGQLPAGSSAAGIPGLRQVVAADPLALPASGDFFEIVGGSGTGFGAITGGYANRRVLLKFSSSLTVFDGAVINMAGNFTVGENSVLDLVHDGTRWLEVGRSLN